jgi:hypothetical protein
MSEYTLSAGDKGTVVIHGMDPKELRKVAHLFGVDNIRRNSVIKDWHYFVADVKIADCWIRMFSREVEDPKEKDLEDAEDIKKEMEVSNE